MRKARPGVVRTTFDLAADAAQLADVIVRDANLPSRKEAVEKSIRFYAQGVEALKQSYRIMIVDENGQKVEMPLDRPVVVPRASERLIIAKINAGDVAQLAAIANKPHHPAANVVLRLAMAASHPHGPQPFPASLLFHLIYWALRLGDAEFLGLARDVITTCVTSCDSFAHLVNLDGMPSFDINHIEQQFLSDEYHAQKRKQLPG